MHPFRKTSTDHTRTRWAAIGAAIAVSIGAGGVGITRAAVDSGERTTYVPITPCRLADTRPAPDNVGSRAAPVGPSDTYTLAGTGTHGGCTIPTEAAGLALNVTAIGATAPTFLTIYPTGSPLPLASNLNPVPGEPPTPNSVNVDLNSSGEFDVFNKYGAVDVIVDIVGYYVDHQHDDRYYTETETDSKLTAKADVTNVYNKYEIDTFLDDKADVGDPPGDAYTKTETDDLLADKADADDVYTKTETDALIDAVSGVAAEATTTPLVGMTPTFTPGAQSAVENFTTTTAGKLFLTRSYAALAVCALGTPIAYLVVDGVAVQSTATPITGLIERHTFTGVTAASVGAGAHTVRLGIECGGIGIITLSTIDDAGSASILVV